MRDSGRIAAAIDRAPEPPAKVSRLQIALELVDRGRWGAFNNWLDAKPARRFYWDLANDVEWNSDFLRDVALEFGFTEAQVDTFFREAAKR